MRKTAFFTVVPVLACAVILIAASALPAGDIDFLIPGVSLETVSFEPGSSVQYLIISEAYGVLDTTMAGLGVIESEKDSFLLEIVSSSWPVMSSETVAVRLWLSPDIISAGSAEDVRASIRSIIVRMGEDDFREPSAEEIEDFGLERLFLSFDGETERRELGEETVETPAGDYLCSLAEFYRSSDEMLDLGGVKAVRHEEETSRLLVSDDVPFWGLVRSRVETSSHTRLESSRRKPRPKVTITESVLISCTKR
ncbi:MAG: hypothetical protein KOO63_08790 [Bacteroidales bacterium]|nr:hypothetical protein [Candidatus Latescibacterota bacterium]